MRRIWVGSVLAGAAVCAAALLLWPHAKVNAQGGPPPQINVEGCTCSRPTTVGTGKEQLSIYYCACPGMQCVVTATGAGASVPPNVVQTCRTDGSGSSVLLPR